MLRQWTTTTRRNFGCFYLSTYCFFFIRGFSTCTTIAWPWNYCFCFVRRKQGVDINLRSDAATSSMGGGLTPCVMTLTNHNRLTNSFIKIIDHTWRHTLLRIVNVNYRAAAHQLRKLKLEMSVKYLTLQLVLKQTGKRDMGWTLWKVLLL